MLCYQTATHALMHLASLEIDTFVRKLKALCEEKGLAKQLINLCVDLGVLQQQDLQHPHPSP